MPQRAAIPSRARAALPVVAVITGLLAAPTVAWAVWGSGEHPRIAATRVALADPEPRRPSRVDPIVEMPGSVILDDNGPVSRYGATGALERIDVELLATGGVVRAQAMVTDEGPLRRSIWRFTVVPEGDPVILRDALDAFYATQGWLTREPAPGEPKVLMTPSVLRDIPGQTPMMRAHYVRDRDLIRVDTYGTDSEAVEPVFNRLLAEQLAEYPPQGVN